MSSLDESKTVLEEVSDAYPKMAQTDLRSALASFLLKGDDVQKGIATLSGGERARVCLLKLMLSGANFLLLDEPTNHLDIRSREALEEAFLAYEGTLLIISHDRYFINKLAHKVICLTPTGAKLYIGGYDAYQERFDGNPMSKPSQVKNTDYKAKKEAEAAKRRLDNQLLKAEQEISSHEQTIAQLEQELLSPEIASDYVKALELTNQIRQLQQTVETLYASWAQLQEQAQIE